MSVAPGSAFERIASPDGGIATLRNLSENPGSTLEAARDLYRALKRTQEDYGAPDATE
jgi:hypothetical protein